MVVRTRYLPTVENAPPFAAPEPMSDDVRRVWSALLPWKYEYENYIPTFTRSLPAEVMELKSAWDETDAFHHCEIWDSEKDPILVGVNPKPSLHGGLLAMLINAGNAARRALGDESQNDYTTLAQWAEHGADILDDEEMCRTVKRDSRNWTLQAVGAAGAAILLAATAAWIEMIPNPQQLLPLLFGVIVALLYLLTVDVMRAGDAAERILSELEAQ